MYNDDDDDGDDNDDDDDVFVHAVNRRPEDL